MPPEGPARYHPVARALHWLTVLLLALQLVLGYSLERADDLLEPVVDGLLGGREDRLVLVHAGLGVGLLLVTALRLAWRRRTGLPPWAPGLSARERRLASGTERALYWLLVLMPLTGLGLLLLSGEDLELGRGEWEAPLELLDDDVWLGAHIASHLALYTALVLHVGLVLKHQLVDRDGLLRRML